MKEKASPAIVAAVVALALLIIGGLGWKFLGPGSKDSGKNPYGNYNGKNGPPADRMPHSGGPGSGVPGSGGPGSGGPGSGGSGGQ